MTDRSGVDVSVTLRGLSDDGAALFQSGFYRDAVRHEAQDLLMELSQRSGRTDLDGQSLVQAVLNDNDPSLVMSTRSTRRERDEHASLRHLLLGLTTGARNIYSHDVRSGVTHDDAVLWLMLAARVRSQTELLDVPSVFDEQEIAE